MSSDTPLWRQAFDAAEQRVTPHAETFVRTPTFAVGAALVRRATVLAQDAARGASARAWHLLNLPAGTDVRRLRTQLGALDREVRRLRLQLEADHRRTTPTLPEETRADDAPTQRALPADGARARPARRGAQRPARP